MRCCVSLVGNFLHGTFPSLRSYEIDKLGNDVKSLGVFEFEPADVTNFQHKCSLLLPGVAHRGTDTPSLGNLAWATQESRNTGNTGFVMTQLRNLPYDMMTSMTSHDFGCLFLQYNSVADSKSCVCIGSSPGCVFSLTGLNASHEMGGTGPSVA